MNPTTGFGVPYGKLDVLLRCFNYGNIPHLLPIDDLKDAENNTYNRANSILQQSENVICIGLSPLGLSLSNLDLSVTRNSQIRSKITSYLRIWNINM